MYQMGFSAQNEDPPPPVQSALKAVDDIRFLIVGRNTFFRPREQPDTSKKSVGRKFSWVSTGGGCVCVRARVMF